MLQCSEPVRHRAPGDASTARHAGGDRDARRRREPTADSDEAALVRHRPIVVAGAVLRQIQTAVGADLRQIAAESPAGEYRPHRRLREVVRREMEPGHRTVRVVRDDKPWGRCWNAMPPGSDTIGTCWTIAPVR